MTHADVRAHFPALDQGTTYLENAGGSQLPRQVIQAMTDYMTHNFVQLGAPYEVSRRCTEVVEEAHTFANAMMGGEGIGKTALGASCTGLITMLVGCYAKQWQPGDEVILCETAHEANAGPWLQLERQGGITKWWKIDPATGKADINDLKNLLTDRTRIVAYPHISNLLGEIVDVPAITRLAHEKGAQVVVDGVAYAPHRPIDVAAWDVDFYVFSNYKVFGPHMASLYGKNDAWASLEGPNHFFVPNDEIYKFELGGANHEGCAALLGLRNYLQELAPNATSDRNTIVQAFNQMAELEREPQAQLLGYLNGKGVRIIGPSATDSRVPTISFLSDKATPPEICAATDRESIGIRFGHMYAYRLCEKMGIPLDTGVTRISLAHYNNKEDVDRLIHALDKVI